MNEKTLQDALRAHLAQVQGLRSYAFAAGGTHGPLHGVVPTGWPDTVVIVPIEIRDSEGRCYWLGKHVYFEIKTGRGKPTRGQPEMQAELREQGCRVEVIQADTIDDAVRQAERVLASEGVLLREWS